MSEEKFDINKALETIIRERNFERDDTTLWESIRLGIPSLIQNLVTDDYGKSFTSVINDPLDSNRSESFEAFTNRLVEHISHNFKKHPPFTIIRLSEILYTPKRHYNTPEKFLRALENVIQVSSSIAEFPETTFEINGHDNNNKVLNKAELNEDTLPVSIGSDEGETIFLTKIPWLTEQDIKEIESEHYLIEEYPINDAPLNEEYDHDERPLENDQKKRTLEEQKDSPEKKHKPSEESVTNEELIKQNKIDEEKSEKHVNTEKQQDGKDEKKRDEVSKQEEKIEKSEDSAKEIPDTSINEADETLDEDKMDINTTLEEDKMDLD